MSEETCTRELTAIEAVIKRQDAFDKRLNIIEERLKGNQGPIESSGVKRPRITQQQKDDMVYLSCKNLTFKAIGTIVGCSRCTVGTYINKLKREDRYSEEVIRVTKLKESQDN